MDCGQINMAFSPWPTLNHFVTFLVVYGDDFCFFVYGWWKEFLDISLFYFLFGYSASQFC